MKKFFKGVLLIPMWPLIWFKLGFNLERDCWNDHCEICGDNDGCCARAHKMVNWWQS